MTGGRPTKLNADTQKAIIDALAFGCTRKDAACNIIHKLFNNGRT